MATVRFSVPDDVMEAFNETFESHNKNSIIAGLMREAVEQVRRRKRSQSAIRAILERRQRRRTVSEEELRSARQEGRP